MTTTTVSLSQDEVYFLLEQMGDAKTCGADSSLQDSLDDAQHQALAAAEQALLSRGIIEIGPDGPSILDSRTREVIQVIAYAPHTLAAISHRPDTIEQMYMAYHADPLWIEHTQPAPGLHQFALSPEPLDVQTRLEQILGLAAQPAPPATAFNIDQAELERITAAATADVQVLQDAIAAAGADVSTAQLFAELLAGPRDSALLQVIDRRDDEERTHTITVMGNQHGMWLMQTTDPATLLCQPASAADVRRAIIELVEQL
ncbi:MAG: hypothetical protein WCF99_05240 [Chloroflexales bacterium]